tara:strand:+ start:503 stop:1621 length:1119 start_codon:yes stop_codon:yes gene_type:complete
MSSSTLLTIGLALAADTYQAKRAFFSALTAVAAFEDIELLVCDNFPARDRRFITNCSFERLRYAPNERNLGAISNFDKIHWLSKSEFVLLLGDDDLINPFFCEFWPEISRILKEDPDCDLYSLPCKFNAPAIYQIDPIPDPFYQHIQSQQVDVRAAAVSSLKSFNYFFYGIKKRNSLAWRHAQRYFQNCPGYTRAFDWAASYGSILLNRSIQCKYPFYVYNNANWSVESNFVEREVNLFKSDLKDSVVEERDIAGLQMLRNAANAAISCSFFLSLGINSNKVNASGFEKFSYYKATKCILLTRFLHLIPVQNLVWRDLFDNTEAGMWELLEFLLTQLEPLYKPELFSELESFLKSTPTKGEDNFEPMTQQSY